MRSAPWKVDFPLVTKNAFCGEEASITGSIPAMAIYRSFQYFAQGFSVFGWHQNSMKSLKTGLIAGLHH